MVSCTIRRDRYDVNEDTGGFFFFFFFYLFITRVRPMEIMARLCTVRFLSAVRAVVARCKHPFALRPGLSPESMK